MIVNHYFCHRLVVALLLTSQDVLVQSVSQLLDLTHLHLIFLLFYHILHLFDVLFKFLVLFLAIFDKLMLCKELQDLQILFDHGLID